MAPLERSVDVEAVRKVGGRLVSQRDGSQELPRAGRLGSRVRRGARRWRWWLARRRARHASTFGQEIPAAAGMVRYLRAIPPEKLESIRAWVPGVAVLYSRHFVDILGSGWVEVKHGRVCRGLEGLRFPSRGAVVPDRSGQWLEGRLNSENLPEARRIWALIDETYVPIDWQLDVKSGYRWSEAVWFRDIPIEWTAPGVDIKVPWELSRMHHVVHLAWAFGMRADHAEGTVAWAREFRNQVLDFIATNPPEFGVNWCSPMDVAIRAVNWLVAYDLFRAFGAEFDDAFQVELGRSVLAHGRHITANLEWRPTLRNNHYLANVAGLLIIGAYLPRTDEVDAWLAFGVQELVAEAGFQFTPDGANFEASTSYHRLSAEMVAFATAFVVALPPHKRDALDSYKRTAWHGRVPLRAAPARAYASGEPDAAGFLPAWFWERLRRMGEFTEAITKPDGHVIQVGDNDSGRFLKLHTVFVVRTVQEARDRYANLSGYDDLPDDATYWDEDHVDHRALPGLIRAVCGDVTVDGEQREQAIDGALLREMLGDRPPVEPRTGGGRAAQAFRVGDRATWQRFGVSALEASDEREALLARRGLVLSAFPYFGLYVMRSNRVYAAIRCGSVGQRGNGGHAHNDQLSTEIVWDGVEVTVDPGSYLYTPLPRVRNSYRSVRAHFAPQQDDAVPQEPNPLTDGLFRLADRARPRCLYWGSEGFVGVHFGYGEPVYRIIRLRDDALVVADTGAAPGEWEVSAATVPDLEHRFRGPVRLSPGYGQVFW